MFARHSEFYPPPARLRASPLSCRRSSPRETDPQGGSEVRCAPSVGFLETPAAARICRALSNPGFRYGQSRPRRKGLRRGGSDSRFFCGPATTCSGPLAASIRFVGTGLRACPRPPEPVRSRPSIRGSAATQGEGGGARRNLSRACRRAATQGEGDMVAAQGGETKTPSSRVGPQGPYRGTRGTGRRVREALMESRMTEKMKIMIFSIKFAKFTGFFDKFPKIVSLANGCNQTGYHTNLSVAHSDMAIKKVFRRPRICPQLPAFAPALHHTVEPSFLNRVRPSLTASGLMPAPARRRPRRRPLAPAPGCARRARWARSCR